MKILIFLLFLVFPFGQLLRFDAGNGIAIHVNDLVVGVVGIIGVVKGIREKNKLLIPVGWWVLAAGASLLFNFKLVGGLYLFRWVAYAGLYFFFAALKNKKILSRGLLFVALTIAVLGIGQYLLWPDTTFLATSNWDDHSFRLISTFLDPGFTGVILVLGLILIFNQFSIFNFSILQTALALTYSRASYLAYLVGIAIISFYKKSSRLFLAAALLLIISLFLLPRSYGESTNLSRENSVWARINNWKQAVTVWQAHPVLGVGFGNYQDYSGATLQSHAKAGSDSSLLTVLATTGILGTLGYLGLLGAMFKKGGLVFRASLIAVFIHSWFNNTLFYPWVMEWLWLVLVL